MLLSFGRSKLKRRLGLTQALGTIPGEDASSQFLDLKPTQDWTLDLRPETSDSVFLVNLYFGLCRFAQGLSNVPPDVTADPALVFLSARECAALRVYGHCDDRSGFDDVCGQYRGQTSSIQRRKNGDA